MKGKVAIIDPVGSKAGIDHYDTLLLKGISNAKREVYLYSNFDLESSEIKYRKEFYNIGVSKISAVLSNIFGFFRSLKDAKKNKVEWLILHVFRGGLFDLSTFLLGKILGFKICAIIHDAESLDTLSFSFIRRLVIYKLPSKRVVHNEFCKNELIKTFGKKISADTGIIPHVNFTALFNDKINLDKTVIANHLAAINPRLQKLHESNTPLILFFGQIKKAKGLSVLIQSLAKTNTKAVLIIAGKLRNESWEKYESEIQKLGLAERVIPIIRHITDIERDLLFEISECVVLPYTLIYQSGVLLMAMSYPTAVIASSLPPNRDLVQHEKNGLLFRTENSEDLALQIDRIVHDANLKVQLRNQALIDVTERYNADKIGQMYDVFID